MNASPIFLTVTGRYDYPTVGETILTDASVQGELQTGGLDQWRGLGEFVEKQHAFRILAMWKKGGRTPMGTVFTVDPWQSAQVHRVQQDGPNVHEAETLLLGCLADETALAYSWRTPEVQGPPCGKQRLQSCGDIGGFHQESP
jgi:hypothetical protein